MSTDDLRTRAREAAEAEWPVDGFWMSAALRQGFIAGYLAHAAQQPSREQIKAEALREAASEWHGSTRRWLLDCDPHQPDLWP